MLAGSNSTKNTPHGVFFLLAYYYSLIELIVRLDLRILALKRRKSVGPWDG